MSSENKVLFLHLDLRMSCFFYFSSCIIQEEKYNAKKE
jgi:hypothetical protein